MSLAAEGGEPAPTACGSVDTHFLSGVAMIDKQIIMLIDVIRLVETSMPAHTAGAEAA